MFSNKLRALRERKGLKQKDMERIFKISQTTYSGWENGTEPKYQTLKELANFFNVSIDYLLDNEKSINENDVYKIIRELNEDETKKLIKLCEISFPEAYKKGTQ